jgi:hypothetical protein
VSEIQKIQTSLDLKTNEVQVISTQTNDINEIQVVQTSAQPSSEVQVITLSPAPGKSKLVESNSFSLALDTTSTGGSLQYSDTISAMACADGCPNSLSEILFQMSNFLERPTVVRSEMNPDGGHSYTITFPSSMKNVPQLWVTISDVPVDVSTVEDGNVLSGFLRLEYDGVKTTRIPYDASEALMESLLEATGKICDVTVRRSEADSQNGYTWEIEFPSGCNSGNVEQLIAYDDELITSSSRGGAVASVTTIVEGSSIQGSFTLGYG